MKVKFTACGGWDREKDSAMKTLTLGECYEVEKVSIDKWCTWLTLKVGGSYNHCLFENNKELEDIIKTGKCDGGDILVSLLI